MIDYNNLKDIKVFYEVKQAEITKVNVTSTSYYTDSAGRNNLVELEYDDFGSRSVNLITNLVAEAFEMNFDGRFITTDVRRAIKIALNEFKKEKRYDFIDVIPILYKEYYEEYPELFI